MAKDAKIFAEDRAPDATATETFVREVPKQALAWTGERLTSEVRGPIEFEHYHRYLLARALCRGKSVLDVSSGEGYGSAFLAQVARSVIGVDISAEAINHASVTYKNPNLAYVCANALDLPLEDASVEVVVSFETLEHFAGQEKFLAEIKRVLVPGGLLLISTPDREIYSPPGSDSNPYHVSELNRPEFTGLLGRHFKHSLLLFQRVIAGSAIMPGNRNPPTRGPLVFERQGNQFKSASELPEATYLIALGSDAALPSIGDSLYIDADHVPLMPGSRADFARQLDEAGVRVAGLAEELSVAGANAVLAVNQIERLEAARARLDHDLDTAKLEARRLSVALQTQSEQIARVTRRIPAPIKRFLKRLLTSSRKGAAVSAPAASANELADVVRNSGFFDAEDYRTRAGPLSQGQDPALHYVMEGERLGLAPSARFDPNYYRERNPDVAATSPGLLAHYIHHGRREGRRPLPLAAELAHDLAGFAPEKETIVLVSHEASRTGAPILALTIGRDLSAKYNVITILLRGGELVESFRKISAQLICLADADRHPAEFSHTARRLLRDRALRYAIVNSIESKDIISALSDAFIPTINLIHEFSSYTRPLRAVREALGWTTEPVFSTEIVAESFRKEHPALHLRRVHVLAQGRCAVPASMLGVDRSPERLRLQAAMRPQGAEDALVVLGAGFIHLRKGVDLFLASAAAALRMAGEQRLRFVWIGGGYDPETELNYSNYLAEQIVRSGLENHVVLLDEVSDLEPAYAMADVFYLSSRLDPLPNVTIEAAARGLPIICFKGASGIADVLQRDPIAGSTVVSHLDASAAAAEIVKLAKDKTLRKRVGEATRAIAGQAFDMARYIRRIDEVGDLAVASMRQRRADFDTIVNDPLFDAGIFLTADAPVLTREAAILRFLALWSAARTAPHQLDYLDWRRPAAGFNPQIYALHHPGIAEGDVNPLADFLRKGKPEGPWMHRVIRPDLATPPRKSELRTAIQAHFHYPELIGDFLDRLAANEARCDLLLSTNDAAKAETLRLATSGFRKGRVEIRVVPNRGRDIAPLLTAYGSEIVQSYDVIGHFHGKRSAGVDAAMGATWREFLWQHLLGSRFPMMDLALSHFAQDQGLGLIFAEEAHLCDWDDNLAIAEELAAKAKLESPLPPFFEFPVGTMFWVRAQALAPLLELRLQWSDYPEEPLPTDGTVLHALERLFPFAADRAGFGYATFYIPEVKR